MSLLVPVAVLCCFSLLGLGCMLGAALRRPSGRTGAAYQASGTAAAAMARVPVTLFLHPRMDLAAGRAPTQQRIDVRLRQLRHELSETCSLPSTTLGVPPTVFEPFLQRRKHSRPPRQRLDRVYARETMGDLSDPVCRRRLAA